jgi:hypothetical protein
LDLDGFFLDLDLLVFVGSGRFFRIWILLVFSLGLDLDGFLLDLDFGFFRIWIFLVFGWIGFVWFFFGNGSVGFQSGLDLKRYFQKALKVITKEVDRYWIFNCLVFLRIGFCQFLDGSSLIGYWILTKD